MEFKRDIKSLNHNELFSVITDELNLPKFRVRQIEEWLWVHNAKSFDEITSLSKKQRAALSERFYISSPRVAYKQTSVDGTRKFLIEFDDGVSVESVGIPSRDGSRLTVCFSTQAGCAMKCKFCATGWGGFTRNLTSNEMFDQVRLVGEDFGQRVTNVVAMGQGEPFADYESSIEALRRMNNDVGLGIGARHITVSTCGIINRIYDFTEEPEQFTLAVSLHSAIQETRDALMPGVASQPLTKLRKALIHYGARTGRRPSLEYALMDQVNDSDSDLNALIEFCHGMLCHVNLIPLNPIKKSDDASQQHIMDPSPRLRDFEAALNESGINVSIRDSRGSDIDGACGQLMQKFITF